MWSEMNSEGQYNIDCRLSGERTMEENVNVMIGFATDICREQNRKVKNRHEGYGYLAEAHQNVIKAVKALKDGMSDLLDTLPASDSMAVDKVQSVANTLADVILTPTQMAAEANRISKDLYQESWSEPTPLEKYAEENDGFEEPEED